MLAKLGDSFLPVLVEKSDDPALVKRFEIIQYPTIVWTDVKGELIGLTVQPRSPDDAISDFEVNRAFVLGESPEAPR